ncbi:hypothetical protein AX14_000074 [Amanita brunnescens Koide BX004]|nr:hypothetical protein AX14_000074 [Amanita brunnescens Koide BX004]
MNLFLFFLFCLLALLADASQVHFGLSLRATHLRVKAHTHSLARDIRLAFGGSLLPRSNYQSQQVIYCKALGNGSPSSGTNATSSPSSTSAGTKTVSGTRSPGPTVSASPWKLAESHQGSNFFNGWSFFVGSDPTNGVVQYVNQSTGQANGLVEVNSAGHAVMRVETTPTVTSTRQSIRITTLSQWNGGLFIMDAVHMPTGCGTWPAFWTNGPTWPITGEIDIVEGVNNYTNNQATVHTNVGCNMASSNGSALSITGTVVGGTNCAADETGNQGCGVRANTDNSFGAAFNSNGGGVYAMQWDSTGIAVYFFARSSIPADISAGAPNPASWGLPQARWAAATCNPFTFFQNHSAIFDTTLCGDWAGSAWTGSGIPGQDQSCATITGYSTCQQFVQASGSAFNEAYWEVNSVNIYQQS